MPACEYVVGVFELELELDRMFSAQIDARFWEWVCNGLELWVCAFKWVFVPGCEYCTISLRMLLRRKGVSACLWVHACVRRSAGLKRFCLNFRCAFFYLASRIKKFFVHYSKFFTLILTSSEPQASFVHFITAKSKKLLLYVEFQSTYALIKSRVT